MPFLLQELTSINDDINKQRNYKILSEDGVFGSPTYKVEFTTVLQTFGDKNRNNRVYSADCAKEIYNQANSLISENKFIGELDHPVGEGMERESRIHLKTVSHRFTKVWLEGDTLHGKGYTLPTPYGMTMASLLKENINLGFSLRAIGFNVKKQHDGTMIVNPPLMLITYDCVATPSHKKAVISELSVKEAMDYAIVCNDGVCKIVEKDYNLQESLCYNRYVDVNLDRIIEKKMRELFK